MGVKLRVTYRSARRPWLAFSQTYSLALLRTAIIKMASNDPALDLEARAAATDHPAAPAVAAAYSSSRSKSGADTPVYAASVRNSNSNADDDDRRPVGRVAPDQFDPAFATTRTEIYAYYAYYIGSNGLSLFNFGPTAFQNLLFQAGGDSGVLLFAGR